LRDVRRPIAPLLPVHPRDFGPSLGQLRYKLHQLRRLAKGATTAIGPPRRRSRQPWGPVTLMSSVKHRTHDWTFSTLASVKLIRRWIVQRRGRDLKTSVIKL
jgi:hypothetical protein